jgi:hypothetical protein
LELIQKWPANVYDLKKLVQLTDSKWSIDKKNTKLLTILYELYLRDKQYDKALFCGLKLGRPNVLTLASEHNLFAFLEMHLELVFEYDTKIVEEAPDIPMSPVRMYIPEGSPLEASLPIRKTRAAVGAEGVRLLASNYDLIPVISSDISVHVHIS